MDTQAAPNIEAVDYLVRSLATSSSVEFEQLAAAQPGLERALFQIAPALLAGPADILELLAPELLQVEEALAQSHDQDIGRLYAKGMDKVGSARLYDVTGVILTAAASALVIILALRIGVLEIEPGGKLRVRFRDNKEPLSAPLREAVRLVETLFSPLRPKPPTVPASQETSDVTPPGDNAK